MIRFLLLLLVIFPFTARAGNGTPSSSQTVAANQQWAGVWWGYQKKGNLTSTIQATGSMIPTLDDSSLVLMEEVTIADLRPGDIAVYYSPKRKLEICHRVMEIKDGFVLFEGDNNFGNDGWIPGAWVKYRVAGVLYGHR